jgi:hypothetical protein
MSDRDTVIIQSAELEQMLEQIGAEGTGLGQKSISLQHLFTPEIDRKFKFICYVRNQAAHQVVFQFDRMEQFLSDCQEVKAVLTSIGNNIGTSSNTQNPAGGTSNPIDSDDFSIPIDLVTFQDINFRSITGRLINIHERTHTTRSKDTEVVTRIQKIWLRLSSGQEEYLELTDFVIEQFRKGHLVTLLFAENNRKNACVTIYIHELDRYFYHFKNINTVRLKLEESLAKIAIYVAWAITFAVFLSAFLFSVLKGFMGQGIAIAIGSSFSYIFLPLWVAARFDRNSKKQFLNHIDRMFGHDLIEIKPLINFAPILIKSRKAINTVTANIKKRIDSHTQNKIIELNREIAEKIADKSKKEAEYESALADASRWQQCMEIHLSRGDENLAEENASKYQKAQTHADELKIQIEADTIGIYTLERNRNRLGNKVGLNK